MSKTGIVNGGSQIISRGIADKSRGGSVAANDLVPQFCPIIFSWAKRGPVNERELGTSADFIPLFGEETFDGVSKFTTHQTPFAQLLNQSQKYLFHRLVPSNIGPKANVRIYLDILEVDIPNYLRNSDGSIATDPDTDEPIVDTAKPTVPGCKIRFIAETLTVGFETSTGVIKAGTMKDASNNPSSMYPIIDIDAKFLGSDYNNSGIILESILAKNKDENLVNKLKSLVYNLYYTRRADENSQYTLKSNKFGGTSSGFTLNDALDASMNKVYSLENAMKTWENETDTRYDIIYNEFSEIYVYKENVDTLVRLIMEKEKDYISTTPQLWNNNVSNATINWFDFTTDDEVKLVEEERYLLNLLTGKSSKNVNYFTVHMDNTSTGIVTGQPVSFSTNTPIWLGSGSDGTLTNEAFEEQVRLQMDKYLDYNSDVMDDAINVESAIIDSGFEMETKDKLAYFIAVRKDTFVFLSTYRNSLNRRMTNEEEYETSAILAIKASGFPESDYYATKACRSLITIGTGYTDKVAYKGLLPQVFDIIYKTSAYMGAADGAWVPGYDFSMGGDNQVEVLKDLQPRIIPNNLKEMLWDVQANWSQADTRKVFFFPALQTVYPYDDSILNSYFNVWIIIALQKYSNKTWRRFTGNYRDSKAEFAKKIKDYYKTLCEKKFDGFDKIVVRVEFTDEDVQRGYSWTLFIDVYSNVSRTVQTTAVFAYRAE